MITIGLVLIQSIGLCYDQLPAAEPELPNYVGSSSCSAFGCHGNAQTRDPAAWKSSFVLWDRHDPHRNAGRQLFSKRSQAIVQSLLPSIVTGEATSQSAQEISDADYERHYQGILERQCIGCHATPSAIASGDTHAVLTEARNQGVSCESCHGAASDWLAVHSTTGFAVYSAKEKTRLWGMQNTQELPSRGAICMDCHVGPFHSRDGRTYRVTHDLIAAGHPRLSFEFSAFLANLPAHFDDALDKQRHKQTYGGENASSFHFDAWQYGQLQMARKLAEGLAETNVLTDFANFDCFACHHHLQKDRMHPRTNILRLPSRTGLPQPADWPLAYVDVLIRLSKWEGAKELQRSLAEARLDFTFATDSSSADPRSFQELDKKLAEAFEPQFKGNLTRQDRLAVLEKLLEVSMKSPTLNWDRVSQFHLALAAFVEDDDPGATRRSKLGQLSNQLGVYLGKQFREPTKATIFDSPEKFNPSDRELAAMVKSIATELGIAKENEGFVRKDGK